MTTITFDTLELIDKLATNLSRDILKFQRVAYNSLPSFPWQRNLIHVLN